MAATVETKVTAATGASLLAGFVVGWLVLKLPALSSLAAPLQAFITALITAGFTFVAGWLAKHTPRVAEAAPAGAPQAPAPSAPEPPPAAPPAG
ncbi:hypothetical protein [Actinomadura rupiterrae]|uniref:hypothetical protein n=1 Tax=Actinomadura rupiterrae TaxID=559627 RepID=UPI0020A32AC3|nr:hypothetical protein [Actinomadura rupiterrae]MCP2341487.1 hypothetical protein [Actinomadura rupiterrae]